MSVSPMSSSARAALQAYCSNPSQADKAREARECVLKLVHDVVDGTMSSQDCCRTFTTYETLRESDALREVAPKTPWPRGSQARLLSS